MNPHPALIRIVFMGTPDFATPVLDRLVSATQAHPWEIVGVVTQPDRPAGRGKRMAVSPVKAAALKHGLPLLQPLRLRRNAEALQTLREWAPDLIVVAAFGQILRADVLSLPTFGCINLHASLLPAYRGASPISAALLNGDAKTGSSIMLMDSGMDTGAVLAQEELAILPGETGEALSQRLAQAGAQLLIKTLPAWLTGEIAPIEQAELAGEPTACTLIHKEDGQIDWTQPALHIERMIRAYTPWPGAYTEWRGAPFKIVQAQVIDAPLPPHHQPGQVVQLEQGIAIITGEGWLQPTQVQPAGKRAMELTSFLNGAGRDFIGSVLGDGKNVD